jgi:hypothetical protein
MVSPRQFWKISRGRSKISWLPGDPKRRSYKYKMNLKIKGKGVCISVQEKSRPAKSYRQFFSLSNNPPIILFFALGTIFFEFTEAGTTSMSGDVLMTLLWLDDVLLDALFFAFRFAFLPDIAHFLKGIDVKRCWPE